MERISIPAIELIVLASYFDKSYFYGISDPFFGMTPEEINTNIESAKKELDKKGFINMGFDGTEEVTEKGKELIDRTLLSKVYLLFDGLVDGEMQNRISYYKNQNAETMCSRNENEIIIVESGIDSVIDNFSKLYLERNVKSENSEKIFICKMELLKELKEIFDELKENESAKEIEDRIVKKLLDSGADKNIAEGICKGLLKNCNYVSVLAGNIKERNLKSFQLIVAEDKILYLYTLNNIENEVRYQIISKDKVVNMIKETIKELEV